MSFIFDEADAIQVGIEYIQVYIMQQGPGDNGYIYLSE